MERGEIWRADAGDEWPVVLLSGGHAAELAAIQVVAPATAAQKHGFLILSPEVAADPQRRERAVTTAGPSVGGVGVEIPIQVGDRIGVVRMALPTTGRIFCTWQLTVARDALIERIGTVPPATMRHLDIAIRLAGIDMSPGPTLA